MMHLSTTMDTPGLHFCIAFSPNEGKMSLIGCSSVDACASTVLDWKDPSISELISISILGLRRLFGNLDFQISGSLVR